MQRVTFNQPHRVSVSRAIKPLVESDGRSSDYFSQKNCAQQYSAMLDKAGTHKRKRSTEGSAEGGECNGHSECRIDQGSDFDVPFS